MTAPARARCARGGIVAGLALVASVVTVLSIRPAGAQNPSTPDARFAGLQWTFARIRYTAWTVPSGRYTSPEVGVVQRRRCWNARLRPRGCSCFHRPSRATCRPAASAYAPARRRASVASTCTTGIRRTRDSAPGLKRTAVTSMVRRARTSRSASSPTSRRPADRFGCPRPPQSRCGRRQEVRWSPPSSSPATIRTA